MGPPSIVDMTSLELVPNPDYCSADVFLKALSFVQARPGGGGVCSLNVRLGLTRLGLVLRQIEALWEWVASLGID